MKAERPWNDDGIPFAEDVWYLYEDPLDMIDDDKKTSDELAVLAFAIGDRRYAIEVMFVVEVLDLQPLTKLPNLPDFVVGVAAVHGSTASILDLLAMMHIGTTVMGVNSQILVVKCDGRSACILVDEVGAATSITIDSIQPSHSMLADAESRCSRGQVAFEDGTVVTLLDVSEVLRAAGCSSRAAERTL